MLDDDKQELERLPVIFNPGCGTCGTRHYTYDGDTLECENGHVVVLSADQRLTFWV